MTICRATAVLLLCSMLVACSSQWTKPGTTPEQAQADYEACERSAAEDFPVVLNSSDSSNRKEYETRCTNYGNQTNCTTRSSDTGTSYQHDRNQEERQHATAQCMRSKGYSR